MHELSIIMGIVDTMEDYVKQNGLTEIEEIVLQIGEMSDVIPDYLEACYPIAVEDTIMANTRLKIEKIISHAKCGDCGEVYEYMKNFGECPNCHSFKKEILDGREFFIKQITAR